MKLNGLVAGIVSTLFIVASSSPALAATSRPANKQTSIGTLSLLCQYDGKDLIVNWTAKPNLPDTLLSFVSGTLRFGTGDILSLGGVPEGIAVRGLSQAGDQEILNVGPGLNPLDAWVSAEADMLTVGLPPHSGTTPTVQVDCEYL